MSIKTESICPRCYARIKADLYERDGQVWMRKSCCGQTVHAMLEKDIEFYKKITALPYKDFYKDAIFVDVTDHCNMSCKYCFYSVNQQSKNPSIAELEETFRMLKHCAYKDILLQGAEATTRDDLDDVIRCAKTVFYADNESVALLTNGVRLANDDYLGRLFDAGLDHIYFSMHLKKDLPDGVFKEKEQGLKNIFNWYEQCESVMFTIDNLDDVALVLDEICKLPKEKIAQFRIRTAQNIGKTINAKSLFMSELFEEVKHIGSLNDMPVDFNREMDNNVFNLNVKYGDRSLRLITCPDKNNIDLSINDRFGPMRIAKDGAIYNFIYSVILDERSYAHG